MSVVVTGVRGFIGSRTAMPCSSRGERVVGLADLDGFYDVVAKERNLEATSDPDALRLIDGDIRDP